MINLSLKYYRAMQKYIRKIEKSKKNNLQEANENQ